MERICINLKQQKSMKIQFSDNIFDILRLWAILQVTLGHLQEHLQVHLPRIWNRIFGYPGVVVLFAISGFLVTASWDRLMDRDRGCSQYIRKRFLRIYPGLWVSIVISSLCIFLFYTRRPSPQEVVTYIATQFSGCNFYTGGVAARLWSGNPEW